MTLAPLAVVGITRYHRPAEGFTMIRDSFLRNAQTSLRAFRVGAYVLSHAAGFIQTQKSIARACGLSVTTVRAALGDLERDRYVARRVVREHGRIVGTAYAVSDEPFTEEELAQLCQPCTESVCRESVHTESVPPKKTTPARETTFSEKTNPSGGTPSGRDRHQETAMNRAHDDTAIALFDVEPAKEPEQPERPPGSQEVVAAYVDSYRRHHSGGDPLRRDIGRVARDAKGILDAGKATAPELIEAATNMGSGPYSNLGVQLNMARDSRPRPLGIAPPMPREFFEEAASVAHAKFLAEIKADPDVAAWVAEDPAEMAKLIAEDPELEAVFARVTAA
jgi:hypothetical protein